jgi:hypothetical protein
MFNSLMAASYWASLTPGHSITSRIAMRCPP